MLETAWEDRWVPGNKKTTAGMLIENRTGRGRKASGAANLNQPGRAVKG